MLVPLSTHLLEHFAFVVRLCLHVSVCVYVCVYGAMPRNEPAGQLGAVRMVCCIPGGDIFNDFQTEPWAALRPTETSCSR